MKENGKGIGKCPMCGAPIGFRERECDFCGSTLILTSFSGISTDQHNEIIGSAITNWKSILKKDPSDFNANYAIGLYYINKKLRDAGMNYLNKAILAKPDVPEAHYNYGLALYNDGNFSSDMEFLRCTEEMETAFHLDPQFKEAEGFRHYFTGAKLFKVYPEEALKECEKSIQICDNIAIFHSNKGSCLTNLGRYGEAQESFYRAIELDSDNILPYINMCLISYRQKKYEKGLKYGKKALDLIGSSTNPEYQAALYYAYGLCQWEMGNKKEGSSNVRKGRALQPNRTDDQNNTATFNIRNIIYESTIINYYGDEASDDGNLEDENEKTEYMENETEDWGIDEEGEEEEIEKEIKPEEAKKDSRCFIATAAYGTPLAEEIDILRDFRDRFLLKKFYGQIFTKWYYHVSPPIASFIGASEKRRSFTRRIIDPLVKILKIINIS